MKKIFNYLVLLLSSFVILTNSVFAADFSISLTSKSVTVGNSVTLSIDGTASGLTGRFNISSSNTSVATVSASSVWIENNVGKVTINTKNAGTSVITVTPAAGTSDKSGNEPKLVSRTITITVNAKQTTNNNGGSSYSGTTTVKKSANNYLSSLTIEGLTLKENFDKEKLEYTVEVPAETEKMKINAQLADSRAKVTGTGEVSLKVGLNTFQIVVTAENGSKRTYTLKATVLELEPIEVTIDNIKYTVVRKRKELKEISEYFVEKDTEIDGNIIEGYYNEKLDYQLVGLKDNAGNIEYYIYDNDKYKLYKEYTFNGTTLQILDKSINGCKKANFIYNNEKISSYQEVKIDILKNTYALDNEEINGNQFYLFYANNVKTGKEYLYQYDAVEKTVQRYNLEVLDMYKETSNTYYKYLLIALIVIAILFICLIIGLITRGKHKKYIEIEKEEIVENEEEKNPSIKSKKQVENEPEKPKKKVKKQIEKDL